MYRRSGGPSGDCLESKPAQTCPLIKQVFRGQVAEPEKFPPKCLIFPTVPVKTMGENPTRVLLVGTL